MKGRGRSLVLPPFFTVCSHILPLRVHIVYSCDITVAPVTAYLPMRSVCCSWMYSCPFLPVLSSPGTFLWNFGTVLFPITAFPYTPLSYLFFCILSRVNRYLFNRLPHDRVFHRCHVLPEVLHAFRFPLCHSP